MYQAAWSLRRPFMVAGLTAFAVTLVSLYLPWWVSLTLAGVCLVLAFFLLHRPNGVFVLLCSAVFLASGSLYVWHQVEPVTVAAGQEDCLTGDILDNSGNWYTVSVTDATYVPVGSRVLLYASDLSAPSLGDTVRAPVRLQALSATQDYRRADGIFLAAYATGYDENSVQMLSAGRVGGRLRAWRQGLVERLTRYLPGQEGALLTAICLGDTGGLWDEVDEAFRASGLTHLLVVSGLHLTAVSGSVLGLLFLCRCRRWLAVLLTMAVTVGFMLFIGLTPSVVRAGVMCLVMLAGSLRRRPADPLNSMGLALMLLLAHNPYMVTDAGLLLSFAATGGVVVITPKVYKWLTACCEDKPQGALGVLTGFWKTVAGGLAASVGATLPLSPLLAGLFGSLSLSAPVANLLAVIPAGWCLLIGWMALLLLCVPLAPLTWLGEGALFLAAMPARWLLWVVRWLGTDKSTLLLPYTWHLVVVTALCVGVILFICRPAYVGRRALAVFLSLSLVAGGLGLGLERGVTNLWVYPNEDGTALLLRQDGHDVLLATHSDALYQGTLAVEDAGVSGLDAVVVGDSDSSNAGQLARLLRQQKAAAVYTTTAANWTVGLSRELTRMSLGETTELWEGATLIIESHDLWLLQVNGSTVYLAVSEDSLTITGRGLRLLTVADSPRYRLTCRSGGDWHSRVW